MFSRNELDAMRETQEAHMMDSCVIYRVIGKTKNARGEPVKTFDQGAESDCGVQMDPRQKSFGDGFVEADVDVILRLPFGTVVSQGDEIEITKRFGDDVTPKRYEVERFPNDGPSGSRAYLKVKTIV